MWPEMSSWPCKTPSAHNRPSISHRLTGSDGWSCTFVFSSCRKKVIFCLGSLGKGAFDWPWHTGPEVTSPNSLKIPWLCCRGARMKAPHFGLYWSCIWCWPSWQRNIVALVSRRERLGNRIRDTKKRCFKVRISCPTCAETIVLRNDFIQIYIQRVYSAFNIETHPYKSKVMVWNDLWIAQNLGLKWGLLDRNRVPNWSY